MRESSCLKDQARMTQCSLLNSYQDNQEDSSDHATARDLIFEWLLLIQEARFKKK